MSRELEWNALREARAGLTHHRLRTQRAMAQYVKLNIELKANEQPFNKASSVRDATQKAAYTTPPRGEKQNEKSRRWLKSQGKTCLTFGTLENWRESRRIGSENITLHHIGLANS